MYAVILTGGKQYIVSEGLKLKVELLPEEAGETLKFPVLMAFNADGSQVKIGAPEVAGAMVEAKIVEHGRHKKISVVKFKRKVRYRRNVGHRQPFTELEITKVTV